MKKEQLKNLYYLEKERRGLEEDLLSIKSRSQFSCARQKNYRRAKSDRTGEGALNITQIEGLLQKNIDRCKREKERLINFISTVEDSRTRIALRLRFLKLKEWDEVAAGISPYETADSVRKLVERFLEDGG